MKDFKGNITILGIATMIALIGWIGNRFFEPTTDNSKNAVLNQSCLPINGYQFCTSPLEAFLTISVILMLSLYFINKF